MVTIVAIKIKKKSQKKGNDMKKNPLKKLNSVISYLLFTLLIIFAYRGVAATYEYQGIEYQLDNYSDGTKVTSPIRFVPLLNINWCLNSDSSNRYLWCVTNEEAVIVASFTANYSVYPSTVYDRYYDYNMEGKLFRGCRVFKLVALGGNVPMLRYEESQNGMYPTDVAMDTIQDILWHTEEFYSDSLSDSPMAEIADRAFLLKKHHIFPWPGKE